MSPKKKKIKVNTPADDQPVVADELDVENPADDTPADTNSADNGHAVAEDVLDSTDSAETTGDDQASPASQEDKEDEEDSLETLLDAAETRAAEYLDSLQRERATFQNYKKRVERERTEQAQQISRGILLRLLPTLDDFHRAMDAVPTGERDEWFEGVSLIQRKLEQFLTNEGVTVIEAEGVAFDPNFHEAIGVDAATDADSGTITMVLQRGYMHGERVLRPAMVRVAE